MVKHRVLAWFDNSIDRWKGAEKGDHTLTLVTTIMWRIWKCRNELLFNRGEPDPKQMVIVAARGVYSGNATD